MIYYDGIIYSWQRGGGVHRYFQKLISFVSERGIESTLLLPEPHLDALPPQNERLHFKRIGLPLSRLPKALIPLARKLSSPLNKALFERFFRGVSQGVFHSTYYTTYESLAMPQAVTVHDMTYEKFPELFSDAGSKRFIERKRLCIEKADIVICVSNATKASLQGLYRVPDEKIAVIHHGVDDFFNPSYDRALSQRLLADHGIDRPFLLFVGNRGKYKNFDLLASAFASWQGCESHDLVVVGGGDFSDAEKARLSELGIASSVKKLGYTSEEELKALYCTTKAFIFPSLDEGFGLPILEALCCGAQVLASDIPVFREIGFDMPRFFDPRDASSLVRALDLVPDRTPPRREEEIQRIRDAFDWDTCFTKTIEAYKKIQPNI